MSAYRDFEPRTRLQLYTLAISPDSSHVAYVDDSLGQFNVAVRPLDGGEPRHLTSYVDSSVRKVFWHPDGKTLVYLADTLGKENYQLYRIRIDGGEPEPLTASPGATYDIDTPGYPFSPNGDQLVYAGNDRTPNDQDVLVRDLTTGGVRRVYDGGGNTFNGYWSPDGHWLTVNWMRGGTSDHAIFRVPADGGPAQRLTPVDPVATYWLGPWLTDGSGFLVRSTAGRDFHGLAVMDAHSGRLSWLDTPDWDVEQMALSHDGRVLVWSVNVDGNSQLRARDLATGSDIPVPKLPPGIASMLTISADGRCAAMLFSSATRSWSVAAIDLTAAKLHWAFENHPSAADPSTFHEPELIHYVARDGRAIPAYLYRPESSTPVGVVLNVHGGPSYQERPGYTNEGLFQYLLSRGVAVLAPNIRGSTGYGMAYQAALLRDWGGIDLSDLADAAEFLRHQDWVDPNRIGLMGMSYGGFAVLSCIARLPEVNWAAAVSWCGPSNLVTFTRSQPPSWRSKVATMIGDPDTDADLLASRSPITYADQIRTPLLVLQGANDRRVPKPEADQIVERLRARGVEVVYDVYENEGHGFGKRDNQRQARTAAAEFLLTHLTERP